ncbi:MAG TPA: hypothetical protein ENI82_01850, partial [Bacteroidetes bacterium]|nr:hypothetical protein [Bacteroidota bacterium]
TKSVSQDLDKVVEKLARVINLHRAADWVDDSYLLMGKAQYVKQDFEQAQKVFEYFVDEMNPAFKKSGYKTNKKKSKKSKSKTSRKKKSRKKKKKSRSKKKRTAKSKKNTKTDVAKVSNTTYHAKGSKEDWDTYNEGLMWMAKTYMERDKWASAYYLLVRLKNENLSDKLKRELPITTAYYYLKQKKYGDAIKPLHDAFTLAKKKKEKARLAFILGQIYESLNNQKDAYAIYKKIEDLNPDYELEFNTKLKILKNYSGTSDAYALKEIKKLLKEEKYDEYQDKIYFTMAEIMLNRNNIDEAITYLNKSISKNRNNSALKAETYFKLGNINFDKQDYISSKLYYDSTLMSLDKKDERYSDIKNLADNLKGIAKDLQTIALQDSLIKISKMSNEQQMELALAIKKKELEEKKRKEEQKKQSNKISNRMAVQSPGMMGATPGKSLKRLQKSSFFAYNPTAVKAGMEEFKKKWGLIRLEDNWRRSNKTDSNYEDEEADIDEENLTLSKNEVNTILRDVPKTPDQLAQANKKIIDAMIDLGFLYRDKLNNYEKSVEILEELFSRYSDFDGECKAMYYLQFSYKDLNNFSKGENIVNKMANKYPDCIYTKILTDPNYVNSKKNKVNLKEIYYQDIFKLYKKGDYESAFAKIENAGADIKKDERYKIKMDFLKAKLLGKLKGKNAYIIALEDFVKQYPNTPESISAKETLRFLKGDKDAFSKLIYEEDLQKFTYEPKKMHYILVVVHNADDKEIKAIKVSISNYNKKYYKLNRLKLSNIYFDTKGKDQVILIRKFETAESAMKYYHQIEKNPDEYINRKFNYEFYAISQKNYREVIKQRSVKNYREFFERMY